MNCCGDNHTTHMEIAKEAKMYGSRRVPLRRVSLHRYLLDRSVELDSGVGMKSGMGSVRMV